MRQTAGKPTEEGARAVESERKGPARLGSLASCSGIALMSRHPVARSHTKIRKNKQSSLRERFTVGLVYDRPNNFSLIQETSHAIWKDRRSKGKPTTINKGKKGI